MNAIDALTYVVTYLASTGEAEAVTNLDLYRAVIALEALRDALSDIYGVIV